MVSMLLCFCPGHPEGNGPVTGLHDLRRPSVGRPRRCHSSEESRDPIPPQISANSFRATLFCFANFSHVLVSPFFYECVPYRRNGGGWAGGLFEQCCSCCLFGSATVFGIDWRSLQLLSDDLLWRHPSLDAQEGAVHAADQGLLSCHGPGRSPRWNDEHAPC